MRSWMAITMALGLVAALPAGATAQHRLGRSGRPVRLEGYWDRTRSHPEVIGTLVISPDGKHKRTLGVTAAYGYQPPEEGVQLFRGSITQPIALVLRGRDELVRRMMEAGPDEKIVALGLYVVGAAQLVLGSVEIKALPSPGAPD